MIEEEAHQAFQRVVASYLYRLAEAMEQRGPDALGPEELRALADELGGDDDGTPET